MKIKVLGAGCSSCSQLYAHVTDAVAALNLDVEVEFVDDVTELLAYEVLQVPALVIDEKVVSAGKDLSVNEVKSFLTQK